MRPPRRPVLWVADDSPTERAITIRSLGSGYTFVELSDGSEVVERLVGGSPHPDALLLDWMMPGMSGDEVCRFLRAQPHTQDLPIIIVTASRVETHDIVQGLSVGANDYISRPFAPEELRARVETVLRAKQLNDIASRERMRLTAINQLGKRLFQAAGVQQILEELAQTLTSTLCDGCGVLLVPGAYPSASVAIHHGQASAEELSAIASLADPVVMAFESSEDAARQLPPGYQSYITRFGLRGLAILPFPIRAPIEGIVTVTRDGTSSPLAPDDISAIETCIEYASLAVQNVMRLDAERTARAQLDAVLEHAPVGIVVTDPVGAVTLANPAASALIPGIEQARDFADTYRLAQWTTPAGDPVSEAEWLTERTSNTRVRRASELVMHPLDGGRIRQLSISRVPLIHKGDVIGDVTTIEDVSAEREIAAERARIAQFQEQMVAIVGHDLRNPLSAVIMGAEAAAMHAANMPPVIKILGRIRSAGDRMTRIIDSLLDVTRARLGEGIPVEPRRVALTPVIRSVLDELTAAHPGATFQLIAADELEGVWDPDRLAQVVANLASNAVHYGRPASPIVVAVSAAPQLVTLTVTNALRDQPIEPTRLRALFEPYQRGRDGKRHAQGLGLGLYIVSEIVRAHHGSIVAESTPAGTVFRIELPRHGLGA